MRIWDIDAGYLNDKSLLGEHRELHGIISIVRNKKRGYSRHPETLRWSRSLESLAIRHSLLVEEMSLRGFKHYSPLTGITEKMRWPSVFIDEPDRQYKILQKKYVGKSHGRIFLPHTTYDLWANHKYSVMARDYNAYKKFGRLVAGGKVGFVELSHELVYYMRMIPPIGSLTNAIFHMWGYVSPYSSVNPTEMPLGKLFAEIQLLALTHRVTYLIQSTALGELKYWFKLIEGNQQFLSG
jgi:hypothetical protein